MARDLNFWKYCENVTLPHSTVYEKLSNGEMVQGVSRLPIDSIRKAIASNFFQWEKLDEDNYELGEEACQIYMTEQFVRFNCYSMTKQHMNELIDMMISFGCYLYDSAINVRFDEQ